MRKILYVGLIFLSNILNSNCVAQTIANFAGGGATLGDEGSALSAKVAQPAFGTFDSHGNYYFFQSLANPRVRMVDTAGIIHTVAGNGMQGFSGDSGLATNAKLKQVNGVAVDKIGNIYIADFGNYRIRKVDATTHIITTICGTGAATSDGDGGPADTASIYPYGICVDTFRNIYVLDGFSGTIRKIDQNGVITRVGGNGTFSCTGDGGLAINASIAPGYSICTDISGNIFFGCNNRIRKINMSTGVISTFAGNQVAGPYNGDEISADTAQFDPNWALVFDSFGNLFMSEYGEHRIRKIDSAHIIHTVAGTGVSGYSGDGGPATSAEIKNPEGVAIDQCNNLYIADEGNNRIRKVIFYPNCILTDTTDTTTRVHNIAIQNSISIYPNPAREQLIVAGGSNEKDVMILNAMGQVLTEEKHRGSKAVVNLGGLKEGVYFITVKDSTTGAKVTRRFVKE